jgi:hypothetical protein
MNIFVQEPRLQTKTGDYQLLLSQFEPTLSKRVTLSITGRMGPDWDLNPGPQRWQGFDLNHHSYRHWNYPQQNSNGPTRSLHNIFYHNRHQITNKNSLLTSEYCLVFMVLDICLGDERDVSVSESTLSWSLVESFIKHICKFIPLWRRVWRFGFLNARSPP